MVSYASKPITCALLILLFSSFGAAQTQSNEAKSSPPQAKRLKVGLVLSGGGSRGIAHVGVIEWFEKNRIPVDYVAGTSMGGLVGAIYAIGMKPEDMRAFLKTLNWNQLLSRGPTFDRLAFRRKEDHRNYQVGLEIGYRKGLSLPLGVSSAHYIGLLIDRLTTPYANIESFNELPIPYRCVATDLLEAKPVILKSGSLASAMRATMAIPAVFPPVTREGKTLVDGGMLNNIPTDAIKEFNPDVVIAVDVGTQLADLDKITSIAGILSQSLIVMTIDNDRRNLRLADIIIAPNLGDLSILDFSSIDKVADLGYQSAEQKASILSKFSVSESEWAEYIAQRQAKIRTFIPTPDVVQITGVDNEARAALRRELGTITGRPLERVEFENELTRITGEGRYESLGYEFKREGDKNVLVIDVVKKTYAPPTLNLAVETEGSDLSVLNFTVGARVTFYDVGRYGAEWRNDFRLGFGNLFSTEYFLPIGERGLFIAPRAAYRRDRQEIVVDGTRLIEYKADNYGLGFDLGYLQERSELRAGYQLSRVDLKTRIGLPVISADDGNLSIARVRFAFDGQNSPTIPTRGLRFNVEGRWFFSAPGTSRQFQQAEAHGSYFRLTNSRSSFFGALSAGTGFKKTPSPLDQFRIGGPFRFGAYDRDELRVNHYFIATAGYLHKFYELPQLVGGNVYAGFWVNQLGSWGGLTSLYDSQHYRVSATTGLVMDTKVGPFSIVGSYAEGGKGKFYFSLGKFF